MAPASSDTWRRTATFATDGTRPGGPGKPMGIARRWTEVKPQDRAGTPAQATEHRLAVTSPVLERTLELSRYHARDRLPARMRANRRSGHAGPQEIP
jgi:hypothetical protein